MGNIHLELNIDRIDLIIAVAVVFIAFMAIIGYITWISKANRQMRTLEKIDDKLHRGPVSYVIHDKSQSSGGEEIKEDTTEPVIDKENIDENREGNEPELEQNEEEICEDEGKDILEEIQKMILEESKKVSSVENFRANNIGKSGKQYTRDELEKLIRD